MASSTQNTCSLSLTENWFLPGCMLAAMTFIGGKYVQRALAQLSGTSFSPVAFSFGWVSYAFEMLALTFSNNMLMPEPDYSSELISGIAGYPCESRSWILSRLLRDFDHWKPGVTEQLLKNMLQEASIQDEKREQKNGNPQPPPRTQAGLCVSVFEAESQTGPVLDYVTGSGVLIAAIQLGISLIPNTVRGDSTVLYITGAGILLSFITGALPRWKHEKWGSPNEKNTMILTRGNGAQHALVIISDNGLNLEKLANLHPRMDSQTRFSAWALALACLFHLIATMLYVTVVEDILYLLTIGGIGTLYNILVADIPRKPEALGLSLKIKHCIVRPRVMEALKEVELANPGVGASMLKIFFPGRLWEDDRPFWAKVQEEFPLLDLLS